MVYCESCGEVDWCGRTSEGQHYPKVLEYNRRAYCGEPQTHRGDEVGHVLGITAAASGRGGLVENEERRRAEAAQAFQRDQVLWPRSVFVIIFAVARSVQYVIVLAQAILLRLEDGTCPAPCGSILAYNRLGVAKGLWTSSI